MTLTFTFPEESSRSGASARCKLLGELSCQTFISMPVILKIRWGGPGRAALKKEKEHLFSPLEISITHLKDFCNYFLQIHSKTVDGQKKKRYNG